ncbi:MAG: PriCT-2 domain-containing protein [Bacteroidetes bacterium]|nr:PriCT-2 domain-containing protein [Bacteroidota bacterium]
MKEKGFCKHIELRWKNCQTVFPPSHHESGGVYNFYYDEPKELPVFVDTEKLISVLEKYCVMNNEKSEVRNQKPEEIKKNEKITYDKERLESALNHLGEHLPAGSYEEWYRIGFALVPLGPDGEKYFIEMSLKNPHYNDTDTELRKKFKQLVKDYDGRVSLGTIYHVAETYGWKKPMIKFWYVDDGGKVKINRTRYKRFLESEGFCKYKIENNYFFVRIENNIVEEIDSIDVKEFVMNYLDRLPVDEFDGTNRTNVIDAVIKSVNQLFTTQFLEFLITRIIEFNKDTKENGYFYFKNGFVEITKNNVHFNNYKKLEKHIWKKQIIKRNYIQTERRSMFEDLLFNICRGNQKRFEALKSGIGYLLHTYKDPSISKAIVFIDEKLSEGAFGRSGKGLVIKGISHIRNIVIEDGRNFSPSKNFAFQRVKADTNIIGIEDIRERFPFDRLFSIITEGITIERKNKEEIFLPFNESPKVILSTNFSISGVDDSTIDRQFIIEFSDYYNKNHRPVDDFGKLFFDGWNEEEWNDFDCFMIECLQFYLKRGLVTYEFVNINKKKLIDETTIEFYEFSDGLVANKEYDKKELYDNFKKEYADLEKLTQAKFTRWLKVYGRINGLEVKEGKSDSIRTIKFCPHPRSFSQLASLRGRSGREKEVNPDGSDGI